MKKIGLILLLNSLILKAYPCTDLQMQAESGGCVIGRTMDFDRPLHSALAIYPRGERRTSVKPNGQKGLSWRSRYAYAGMNELGNRQMISDGINEKGLALEDLWLAETQYNQVSDQDDRVLLLYDLPAWLLGNCASVAEVKRQLPLIKIWANKIAVLHSVPPLHFAIHDASGANIVVEFLNHQTVILDNPVGALTNSPPFAWQLTHLSQYAALTRQNPPKSAESPIAPGSGLIGMPGDYSPVSRFVRGATLLRVAGKASDSSQAVLRMSHLLNAFDVPYDAIKDSEAHYPGGDYTQWSIVKDVTRQLVWIRPHSAMGYYRVDLASCFQQATRFTRVPLDQFLKQNSPNVTRLFC